MAGRTSARLEALRPSGGAERPGRGRASLQIGSRASADGIYAVGGRRSSAGRASQELSIEQLPRSFLGSFSQGVRDLARDDLTHTEANSEGLGDVHFGEAQRRTLEDVAAAAARRSSAGAGRQSAQPARPRPMQEEPTRDASREAEGDNSLVTRATVMLERATVMLDREEVVQLRDWFGLRVGTKRQLLLIAVFVAIDSVRFASFEYSLKRIDPTTVFVAVNILSSLLSATIAVAMEGRAGWDKLWTWGRMGRSMQPAILFTLAQISLGYAFHEGITAAQNVTVGFIYMPFAMMQASSVLRRHYGRLEWLAMAMLTVSVATFVLVLFQGRQSCPTCPAKPGIGILDSSTPADGVLYVVVSAVVSAMGSTLAERQMKDDHNADRHRLGDHFIIHKFHLDVGAVLVSVGFWLIPLDKTFEVNFWEMDWSEDVPIILLCLAQSWLAALLARHFSTVTKAVSQTITVVVVFFAFARGPNHERHVLIGARYTFCTASVCLAAIVVASVCVFQTGRINMQELAKIAQGSRMPQPPRSDPSDEAAVVRAASADAVASKEEEEGTSRSAVYDQLFVYSLLLMLVFFDAGKELTRQWALGGGSVIVIQSVTVLNSTISIAVASLMAAFSDGRDGLKQAWDWRKIVNCSKVAVFFSLAATLSNVAYVFGITATASTILGYSSMPLSAILSRWLLNKYYMWLEWFALLIVTLSSIAYSMLETYAREELETGNSSESSGGNLAPTIRLVGVVISVVGGLAAEKILKGERLPFCVLKVHLEGGGLLTAVLVLFFMPFVTQRHVDKIWVERPLDVACSKANPACMQGPDFCASAECHCDCGAGLLVGWNHRIVILLTLNVVTAWIGGLVAKYSSTVLKGVAQCCSLLVIYGAGRTLMPQSSGPASTAMTLVTLITPLSVFLFQVAAAEMQKVWDHREAMPAGASPEAETAGAEAEQQTPQEVELTAMSNERRRGTV